MFISVLVIRKRSYQMGTCIVYYCSVHSWHVRDQDLTLCRLVQIRKQSAREDAEEPEPEPEPEPKERTTTVLKSTDGLGLTEAGVKVLEDVRWNEQRATSTGQGTVTMRAYWLAGEWSSGEEEVFVSQTSVLDLLMSPSRTCASPAVLLDSGYDDTDDSLQSERKCLLLKLSVLRHILYTYIIVDFS